MAEKEQYRYQVLMTSSVPPDVLQLIREFISQVENCEITDTRGWIAFVTSRVDILDRIRGRVQSCLRRYKSPVAVSLLLTDITPSEDLLPQFHALRTNVVTITATSITRTKLTDILQTQREAMSASQEFCVHCGKDFNTKSHNQAYCSSICRHRAQHARKLAARETQ